MMLAGIHKVGLLEINEVVRKVNLSRKPDCKFENDFEAASAHTANAYVILKPEGENFMPIEGGQIRGLGVLETVANFSENCDQPRLTK